MPKIKFLFLTFVIILGGFFICQEVVEADTSVATHVVISEVYGGGGNSGAVYKNDFIELYNPTDSAIDLNGWSVQYAGATGTSWQTTNLIGNIQSHSFYLIKQAQGSGGTTDLPTPNATGTIAMSGTAGKVALLNDSVALSGLNPLPNSSIVDFVGFGSTASAFETAYASAPSNTKSIKRKLSEVDTDDNSLDFETADPYPESTQPMAEAGADQNILVDQTATFAGSNSTPTGDLLTYSWDFGDGSPLDAGATVSHTYSAIGTYTAILTVSDGNGGTATDQLTVTVSESPPPGPVIEAGDIVINEFVSDPVDGDEWVELYNKTDVDLDLMGLVLKDGAGTLSNLSGTIAGGGEDKFKIIEWSSSKLNNSGDLIFLETADETVIDQVAYGNWADGNSSDNAPQASDPYSVARITDGQDSDVDSADFRVTTTLTKGLANMITDPPPPPTSGRTKIITQTTETTESPNQETTVYSDKIFLSEVYPNPPGTDLEGEFIELYNLSDVEVDLAGWKLSDSTDRKFTIATKDFTDTKIPAKGCFVIKRQVSKISLNNSGTEYVRLYQPNNKMIDEIYYSGSAQESWSYAKNQINEWLWTSTVTPEKENVFTLPPEPPVAVISCSSAQVEVGEMIDCDAEDSDGENLAYHWQWGDGVEDSGMKVNHVYDKTGSHKIILEVISQDGLKDQVNWKVKVVKATAPVEDSESILSAKTKTTVKKVSAKSSSTAKIIGGVITDLSKLDQYSVNDSVTVEGVAAVLPGTLGTQIMYIDGLQIYSNKKDFPELKIGDRIRVFGTLSIANGELRLKTKTAEDFTKVSENNLLEPKIVKTTEVNEEIGGQLVKVIGRIVELKGSTAYIDDGEDELQIYLKTSANINKDLLSVGQDAEVTGIVSATTNGTRLLPRGNDDIRRGEVLGATTELPQDYKMEDKSFWQMFGKYLAVIGIALLAVGISWGIKRRQNSKSQTTSSK